MTSENQTIYANAKFSFKKFAIRIKSRKLFFSMLLIVFHLEKSMEQQMSLRMK